MPMKHYNRMSIRTLSLASAMPSPIRNSEYVNSTDAFVAYIHKTPWTKKHKTALVELAAQLGAQWGVEAEVRKLAHEKIFDLPRTTRNRLVLRQRTSADIVLAHTDIIASVTADGRGGWSYYLSAPLTRFALKEAE